MIGLGRVDRQAALARVAEAPLSPEEKLGISLALKGIAAYEQGPDHDDSPPCMDQLEKVYGGVLVDEVDSSCIRTWLLYTRELSGMVKDEGGVERVDHEPDKKEGAGSLGVQLSLTAYGFSDQGPSQRDAEEVEKE
jgi:hypothetical protein